MILTAMQAWSEKEWNCARRDRERRRQSPQQQSRIALAIVDRKTLIADRFGVCGLAKHVQVECIARTFGPGMLLMKGPSSNVAFAHLRCLTGFFQYANDHAYLQEMTRDEPINLQCGRSPRARC